MLRKFFLLSLCMVSLFITEPLCAVNRPNQASKNKSDDLKIKTSHLDLNLDFAEDIVGNSFFVMQRLAQNLKKHPAFFSCLAGGLFGSHLYSDEFKEARKNIDVFVKEHKGQVLLAGLGSLAFAYMNRKSFLKQIPEIKEDACVHASSSDEKDHEMNMCDFSKSSVRVFRPGEIKTCFNDIAGLETSKEELSDILMFLKDAAPFANIGAKIPKGLLLSGAPGNGKTLLARALAGEVRCPFLYVSGSEFIQAIVGVGAARVRNLFAIARDLAPCIIFIDEIDAIGRKRGVHGFGGDTELAQTLNQLLVEMDGFEQQKNPIIVIGATNRVDVLDNALTRPGRFDRKIEIGLPFMHDRCKILALHIKNIKSEPNLDLLKIARGTPRYSGAELAQLVNEAAILALRDGKQAVSMLHFDQARDNINLGRETKGMDISEREYWQTAVHEAGHALALIYQKNSDPLHKVTIVPRNKALGITFSMANECYSKFAEDFRTQIVFCLGGSVAEEIMYNGRGAGAHSDLQKARELATQMVMKYGMTKEFKDITFEHYLNNEVHLPDELAAKLQQEVTSIIHECRQIAYDIVFKHKDKLEKLVQMLLKQGTVYGADVYKLCGLQEPDIEYSLAK